MSEGSAVLPVGVEEMPAGPALCAVLEGVDPVRVSPYDSMRLLAARRRQLSWEESRFAFSALQAALADPQAPDGRTEAVGRFGADELREVLHESAWAVDKVLGRAEFAERWPIVDQAWQVGDIDQERVRILDGWTAVLTDEHRGEVLRVVVPDAGGLPLKALMDRIEQVSRDLDPEWAHKRYERHKAQRRVRARRTDAGTANLSGLDLGLDDVAYAERHLSVMADRAKALGHPGLKDTIEADLYVAMLKPRPPWWTDDDLLAAVVAAANPADPADPRPAPEPDQAPEETIGPDGTDLTTTDPKTAADADADADAADAADAGAAGPARPSAPGVGQDAEPREPAPDAESAADAESRAGAAPGPASTRRRSSRRTRLALRVGLLTLLGLDAKTARLPGYGIVHAEQAVTFSQDWADAEWRLALQDHTGALSTVLVLTRRPDGWATVPINPDGTPRDPRAYHPATGHPEGSPSPPRPLVVIHATEDQLAKIDLGEHPAWAALLTHARRQLSYRRCRATDLAGDDLGVDMAGVEDLGGWLADLVADAAARFPTAEQRRWITERNQTCTYPPCGADAVHAQIDHTRPHAGGGPTLTWNLGPACAHENLLKEQPGWTVTQPHPGHFVWHGNTGHDYPSRSTGPVPDQPDPAHFAHRSGTEPFERAGNQGAWTNQPYPGQPNTGQPRPGQPGPHPPARPPPGTPPDDDPPPF